MTYCQIKNTTNCSNIKSYYYNIIMELKRLRMFINKTQEEVAKELSLAVGTYRNYEQGRRELNIETLIKLADYFHVTIDTLIGHETDRYLDMSFLTETQVKLINKIKDSTDIDCAKLESYLDGMKNR